MKKTGIITSALFGIVFLFATVPTSTAQTMGGSGDKIYENRLCDLRPGSQGGTECTRENPEGLCTTYVKCP